MAARLQSDEARRILDFLATMPRYGNTTTDRATAQDILRTTDGWIMAQGLQWDVKVKGLGLGVYRVTLEERGWPVTPSDEAVQRGARALCRMFGYAIGWQTNTFDALDSGLQQVVLRDTRAVLDAAFPSGEQPGGEDALKIARMERDWLLGAWAAATGVSQVDAEAEFLKWSSKWRDVALAESSPSGEYQRAVSDVVEWLKNVGVTDARWTPRMTAEAIERRFAPTSEGEDGP